MAGPKDRAKGFVTGRPAPETDAIRDHHLPNYLTAFEKSLAASG
ncbi:hypothetical protein [Kitasatospora purpeofusca]